MTSYIIVNSSSTVQYSTVQYSTVQYSAVQYSTVHCIIPLFRSVSMSYSGEFRNRFEFEKCMNECLGGCDSSVRMCVCAFVCLC